MTISSKVACSHFLLDGVKLLGPVAMDYRRFIPGGGI